MSTVPLIQCPQYPMGQPYCVSELFDWPIVFPTSRQRALDRRRQPWVGVLVCTMLLFVVVVALFFLLFFFFFFLVFC